MDPITLILAVVGLVIAILFGAWQVYIGYKQLRSNRKLEKNTLLSFNGKNEISVKPAISVDESPEIEQEYRESLIREYKDHVIRGFSPRIGGRDVSLPLAKIFLPLEAIEGRPALAQCAEEDIYRQMAGSAMGELDWQRRSLETEKRSAQLNVLQAAQKPLSLAQLLDNSRAILLGDPGTGKTTITHYITFALASNDSTHVGQSVIGLTPVLVRLANYGKAFENNRSLHLVEYIEKDLTPKIEFGRYLRKAIEKGQCLIILDGLDEIGDPSLRIRVTERIQTMVAGYNRNHFLVTSRIVGYDRSPLTREFKHATLKKLEPTDQARFVKLWYDALAAETSTTYKGAAENLITALNTKPQISRLAANPLLLTIMVLMHWRGVKLPSRRVEIYENATDTLIEYWTMHREGVDLDGREIRAILEPIAHYILSSNVSGVIAHHDLLPRFHKGIAERRGIDIAQAEKVGRGLLRELGEESGIFLERGLDANGHPVYGFLHQTFGEYLAALKMADEVLSDKFDIGHYIHRSIWREPLLLLVGHLSLVSQSHLVYLMRQILDFKGPFEERLKQNVILAADCLADDIQIRPDLRDEILSKLAELLWHEAPQARERAVDNYHRLAMTRHREIATKILKDRLEQNQNLDDLSPEIRFSLTQALVHLDQQDTAKQLLWPLETERYKERIRQDKVQRLHFEGWPKLAVDYILQLQADVNRGLFLKPEIDLSKFVFGPVDAATALRVIGEKDLLRLIDALLDKIKDEEDRASLKLLAALIPKAPEAEKLTQLLSSDTPAEVRCLAAIKLLETEHRNIAIEILHNLVAAEPKQAPRAAQALLQINEKDKVSWQLLRHTAFIGDDESVTNAIVVLLEAGEVTTAIPAAINLLCFCPPKVHIEEEIRLWPVVEALIKYGHTALGLEAARWLALRPGYYYRLQACEALLDAGQVESAIPLLKYLTFECHDKFSRGACQRLLMLKEVERLAPLLANVVNSDDAEMCYHACMALFLANCRPESCASIARCRTELKISILDERTIALQNTLTNFCKISLDILETMETTNEQEKAFISLAHLALRICFDMPETNDQNDAVDKLLACDQPIVKMNAILFDLSAGNMDRVKGNLIELLSEKQNILSLPVYLKTIKTLGQIACPETTAVLLKVLENEDKRLRKCAIEVLGPLGDQSITPYLIKMLDDKDKDLRQAAAQALGGLGDPLAIESLINVLKDEDYSVRENAASALNLLKDPIAVEPLIKALKDNNDRVRSAAAAALGNIGDFRSTQSLIDILKDKANIVRAEAAYVLGRLKNPIAVHPLIEALDDRDADVNYQVAQSLGALGDPLAIKPLIKSINFKGERYFSATAYALASLQDNSSMIETLINAVDDEDNKIRTHAAAMLAYIGNPVGISLVIEAQSNANKWIRDCASFALCFLEDPNLSKNFVVAMYDEAVQIRGFASWGLGKTNAVTYSLHLKEAMRDEHRWIRGNAIEALGSIENSTKLENMALITLVTYDSWPSSVLAEAVAKLNKASYTPFIEATSVAPHAYIAIQYARALIHLAPQRALPVLERYTQQFRRYASIRNLMGQAKWSVGETDSALNYFLEAIELEARTEYLLSLTRLYLTQDDLQLASQYLDQAYKKAYNYFEREPCLLHQAVLQWLKGDKNKGLETLKLVKSRRRKSFVEDLQYNDFWREKELTILTEMLGQLEA